MYTPLFIEKLRAAGLEEKEAIIYAYILAHGGSYPSAIAEYTKINRTTVYKILTKLCVQGIIGEIENKKKLFYIPESAERFMRTARYRKERAEDAYEKARKMVPELEGLLQVYATKPKVTFYEGKDAVIEAYISQVDGTGNYELCAFANTSHLEDFLPKKVFKDYIKTKEKKRITARGIIPATERTKHFLDKTHATIKTTYKPKIRYVPEQLFPFEGEIIIYQKNKVQFIKFDPTYPISVIVEDTTIHNMMKMIFELAWKSSQEL